MKIDIRFFWSIGAALLCSCLFLDAQAQEGAQSQGQTAVQPPISEAQAPSAEQPMSVGPSDLTFRPSAGAIIFEGNERLSTGLLADINFFKSEYVNVGLASGALYSGLNNTLNGASGFSSGISTGNNTFIFQVPVNLTLNLFPGRLGKWSLGPHVGTNVIYSSSGVGNAFGTNSSIVTPGAGGGATWNAWLDAGPEVQYSLTDALDVGVRYDSTFASTFKMHTLTLGLGFRV